MTDTVVERPKSQDQYTLRVRKHSELGKMLAALEDGPKTAEELQKIGGLKRSYGLLKLMPKFFDNLGINARGSRARMHYTNVMPSQVQVVTSDATFEGGSSGQGMADIDQDNMRWPMAPPLIQEMENFDRPTWFENMRKLVAAGKHISLEGPPGTGKDTAVEQLAAQDGRPLVTIGGDAGFRRRDLTGSVHMSGGTSFFEVAEYAAAAVNGWWVLLTEVNAADADAIMYLNTQLAPPNVVTLKGKAYPVHPDFRIFITYNSGLIGTKPLPQSFKDRFFPIKVGFFTYAQLRRRLTAMGMPEFDHETPMLVRNWQNAVLHYGLEMWEAHKAGQMRYQVTTRRLSDASLLMSSGVATDVKTALSMAVIGAIDSEVESRAAKSVLGNVISKYAPDNPDPSETPSAVWVGRDSQ